MVKLVSVLPVLFEENGWTILSTQEFWWRLAGVKMRGGWSVSGGTISQLSLKLPMTIKTQRVASVASAVGF